MRCKICSWVGKNQNKEYHNRWQICGKCYLEITAGRVNKNDIERNQHCIICKTELRGQGKLPCCSYGSCRSRYYRRNRDIALIDKAIETGDYSTIDKISKKSIIEYGYKITITKYLNSN